MTADPTGEPPTYHIRVRGRLGPESDRLGGMKVTVEQGACGAPFTGLTGQLTDEAAVMGVLEHLYNLGLPLLGVERVGFGRTEESSVTTARLSQEIQDAPRASVCAPLPVRPTTQTKGLASAIPEGEIQCRN